MDIGSSGCTSPVQTRVPTTRCHADSKRILVCLSFFSGQPLRLQPRRGETLFMAERSGPFPVAGL